MNRSELVITIVGLTATYCMPWPGARQPALNAPDVPQMLVRQDQNITASTPWVHTVVDRVGADRALLPQLTR